MRMGAFPAVLRGILNAKDIRTRENDTYRILPDNLSRHTVFNRE